ncbi:MAG: hypothetical protein ACOY9J_03520 [Pseudomonadota bacterium]
MKAILKRLKSRTVWLGIAVQLLGVLTLVQSNLGSLNIPPQYAGWAAIIVGTLIGVLRELTTKPVSEK